MMETELSVYLTKLGEPLIAKSRAVVGCRQRLIQAVKALEDAEVELKNASHYLTCRVCGGLAC
jgi:hypothetical protein